MNYRMMLILGAVFALAMIPRDAAAAETRHLICRGKAGSYYSVLSAPGRGYGMLELQWSFDPYTGAAKNIRADGGHLSPGQCSWDDAPFTQRFGQFILYHTDANPLWIHAQASTDPDHRGESFGALAYLPANTRDKNLMWLPCICDAGSKGSILDPEMVFHFHVEVENYSYLILRKTTWNSYPNSYRGR